MRRSTLLAATLAAIPLLACAGVGGSRPAASRTDDGEVMAATTHEPPAPAPLAALAPTTEPRPLKAVSVTSDEGAQVGWYLVLHREVDDSRIKTQVELRVQVNRDATGARLERVLRQAYNAVANETGFRNHTHPNSIWIFAYDHPAWEQDSIGWVGQVAQAAVDPGPSFTLNDDTRPDMDRLAFADRVQRVCPVDKHECTADATTHTAKIVHAIDHSPPTRDERDTLWFEAFFSIDAMFHGLPDLEVLDLGYASSDGVVRVHVPVVRRDLARLSFVAHNAQMAAAEQKLGDQLDAGRISDDQYEARNTEADRRGYRELLARLPAASVAKGYAP